MARPRISEPTPAPLSPFQEDLLPPQEPLSLREAAPSYPATRPAGPLPRTVQVTIRRSGDNERDFRLLTAVHELLTSYPGQDRFVFLLLNGPNGNQMLEFPNQTTHYCPELGAKLADLVGPDAIRVL